MKATHFFLASMLLVFSTAGCKDDPKNGPVEEPKTLSIADEDKTITADYQLSKQEILVTTNAKALTSKVTLNEQKENLWCTTTFDKKKSILTVRIKENFIKQQRTAIITISVTGANPIEIAVTQAAAEKERDPYFVDFSGTPWNESWDYYSYLHEQGSLKFDPWNYDPSAGGSFKRYTTGDKLTLALKLDKKFLTEFAGRIVNRVELRANGPIKVTIAILKKASVDTNTGKDYIKEKINTTELWRSSEIDHAIDVDWVICDASTSNVVSFKLDPADEEIYIAAFVTGGSKSNGGAFECAQQVLSPLVPGYVSFDSVDGNGLYHFVGGSPMINFYMSEY